MKSIAPLCIERYKKERLEHNKAKSTINKEIITLKLLYKWAIEHELIDNNPIAKVKLFPETPGRIRYLTQEEIERLLPQLNATLHPVVVTALHTGMRRGELVRLKWKDVDFTLGLINIHKTKNGEPRSVPMTATVRELLSSLYKGESQETLVFRNKKGTSWYASTDPFDRALRLAEIKDFHFHDLRHTAASYLVMQGVDIRTVQEIIGHKDITMTMRYSHLSEEHKSKAIKQLDVAIPTSQVPICHKSGTTPNLIVVGK